MQQQQILMLHCMISAYSLSALSLDGSRASEPQLIASGLLLATAFFGEMVLAHMGITLAALRTAGGVLLLLMAIDMVFARHSGAISTTREETDEAAAKTDISTSWTWRQRTSSMTCSGRSRKTPSLVLSF